MTTRRRQVVQVKPAALLHRWIGPCGTRSSSLKPPVPSLLSTTRIELFAAACLKLPPGPYIGLVSGPHSSSLRAARRSFVGGAKVAYSTRASILSGPCKELTRSVQAACALPMKGLSATGNRSAPPTAPHAASVTDAVMSCAGAARARMPSTQCLVAIQTALSNGGKKE